jgi:hypothetical protein
VSWKTVLKAVGGLAAIGVLGVLFVRSARSVGSEPYTIARGHLAPWTLATAGSPGVVLSLMPPPDLAAPLFSQVFTRSGVSLSGPSPASMPLLLGSEFDQTLTGVLTPQTLLDLARAAGLESAPPVPLCMATRRVSQPGSTREVFFLRFELSSFDAFRQQVSQRVRAAGGSAARFDPAGLSPVVIIAASDNRFGSWLPLGAEAATDCLAPIVVQ